MEGNSFLTKFLMISTLLSGLFSCKEILFQPQNTDFCTHSESKNLWRLQLSQSTSYAIQSIKWMLEMKNKVTA